MSNRLTIAHAVQHRADRAHLGNTAPQLGVDYEMVETGACPSCRGTGEHKGAVPYQCGVCLGSGRAVERKPITELGRQLVESEL